MTARTPPAMSDLKDGTKVLHLEWLCGGTIRVAAGVTQVRWEDGGDCEVSPEGPVFPSDLAIVEEGQ